MPQMTGGQALVESFKRHGLEVIFGLPGVQLDWAFDALYDAQDSIHVYHTRHEQATSYMADGYARSTGKIGACLVVPGPGLLNAMAGLSTAYACSSPVLCIAGQIESEQIDVGRGMLHEIPEPVADDPLGDQVGRLRDDARRGSRHRPGSLSTSCVAAVHVRSRSRFRPTCWRRPAT